MKLFEEITPLAVVAGILGGAALLAGIFTPAQVLTWLSLAFAIFIYFFLPGCSLLMHLELDTMERCIFAFPIGAILTSVLLYIFNIISVKFNIVMVLIAILIVTIIPFLLWLRKKKFHTTSLV